MSIDKDLPDSKILELLASAAGRACHNIPASINLCQSPIERLFFIALWSHGDWLGKSRLCDGSWHADLIAAAEETDNFYLTVWNPQVVLGPYTADFMFATSMFIKSEPPFVVAVECDGHEFHDRTKEQARRDKARDRYFAAAGVQTLRFTGSEIWADAEECAREVLNLMSDRRHESRERFHALRAKSESMLAGDEA